jgi:hypothetical protein
MVMPENVEDVSRIAKVISGKKCPFGIRSGAHSAWKGANSVQKGVTVDFGTLSSQWPGSCEVLTNSQRTSMPQHMTQKESLL